MVSNKKREGFFILDLQISLLIKVYVSWQRYGIKVYLQDPHIIKKEAKICRDCCVHFVKNGLD